MEQKPTFLKLFICLSLSEGRKHDAGMLADSNLLANLQAFAFSRVGDPICIYGDPAYPLRVHLQAPFRNALINATDGGIQFFHEFRPIFSGMAVW